MSNFDKAIKIIMAEPPEPHYPAYYADLLREADVPDKDVGECSETIYRQAAIEALSVGKKALSRVLDEIDVVSTDREKFSWGLGLIESAIKDIEALPPAQPKISLLTVKVAPNLEELERTVRKIKDTSVMVLSSSEPETCEGCKHLGHWENEVECGVPSPCTCCKRRAEDWYER